MSRTPRPQEIYKHFKGNLYQIITLAEHSETGEIMVIYQALYGSFKVYARPLASFISKVDNVKYPDVKQEYRFELQQWLKSVEVKCEQEDGCCQREGHTSISAVAAQETPGKVQKSASNTQESKGDAQEPAGNVQKVEGYAQEAKIREQEDDIQEDSALDPLVWDFLDADSHEARLNILAALHHRITDDMITTMAVACDIEVADGDLEERYSQLKSCLQMLDRFEIRRN